MKKKSMIKPLSMKHLAPRSTSSLLVSVGAALAIVVLFVTCIITAKRDSVSWDESQHLYSGWLSWERGDFGYNPEVPPFVKMWDAIPLLHREIKQPEYTGGEFKREGFVLGQRFLAANGIDRTLIPARRMASLLTVFLAIVLFFCAKEMFGDRAALFALVLFCFDPNFLAHGSFVTTDIGASLTMLLSIFCFYRVLNQPSALRIGFLGLAVGMTFTAKFTGIFVIPMLILIALLIAWTRRQPQTEDRPGATTRQLLVAIMAASLIGYLFIWAIYRFRYDARPPSLSLNPATNQYLQELASPRIRSLMFWVAKHHLLPEAYIYGLADTKISAASLPSYLFGHVTHRASRLYYPAALAIKSTLPFLILLLVTITALVSRRWKLQREVIVLTVPPAILFIIASTSDIGIGFRHLMPIFPPLYILIAGCASQLVTRNRNLLYAFGALLLWQVGTSVWSRPGLVAYANEAWGGPANTHLYLSDSNTDWGQQLRYVKKYLDEHPDQPCYFAYFEQGPVDYRDYGIHCQVLPTGSGSWAGMSSMHFGDNPVVSGLVLISDGVLAGADIPGKANPYAEFQDMHPSATIDRGVYVYQGHFNLGPAAAVEHIQASAKLLKEGREPEALSEAQTATHLDPASATAWKSLGDAFAAAGNTSEAKAAYQHALYAPELDPVFQENLVKQLQAKVEQ